ncbi:FGGY family carbohydrate kinase [Propionibacteriaceae bacterium Y1923]
MGEVVVGVDAGTTAVKAVAFSLDGEIISAAHRSVPVNYGRNGEAEQSLHDIWEAVADGLAELTGALGDSEIIAVGLTGQGDGAWLLDKNNEPLRNAAIWMDGRAGKRVEAWQADGRGQKVLDTTGTTIFPALVPVLLEEFAEQDPGFLDSIGTLFHCKDWVRFKLTGKLSTDYTEASRSFFNVSTGEGHDAQLAEDLGLAAVLPALPEILSSDASGGEVTEEAAARTGLPTGIPVSVGMIDVAITGPGLGAINDGDAWLILGTTGFIGALLPSVEERRSDLSMVLATGRGRQVLEFLAPMTGTPNLDWIRDTLGFADWAVAEAQARSAHAGAGGVVYLPYASPGGERAPFLDPNASASWLGMSVSTTPAQVLRSVYEGVSFSLVECAQVLRIEGDLVVSGGGFRSDLICEILADTTGQRVIRQDAPEAGARGAATLALVASGAADDVKAAAAMMVTSSSTFEPNPEHAEIYAKAYEVYRSSRDALRPAWPTMRELRGLSDAQKEDDK